MSKIYRDKLPLHIRNTIASFEMELGEYSDETIQLLLDIYNGKTSHLKKQYIV